MNLLQYNEQFQEANNKLAEENQRLEEYMKERSSELFELLEKKFEFKILSFEELYNDYFASDYFDETNDGNKDIYERIKYLVPGESDNELHFCIIQGKKIIGVAGIQSSIYDEDEIRLKHISIDENYWGEKLSTRLLEFTFSWISESKYNNVLISFYTPKGEKTVKKHLNRLAEKYSINLQESN